MTSPMWCISHEFRWLIQSVIPSTLTLSWLERTSDRNPLLYLRIWSLIIICFNIAPSTTKRKNLETSLWKENGRKVVAVEILLKTSTSLKRSLNFNSPWRCTCLKSNFNWDWKRPSLARCGRRNYLTAMSTCSAWTSQPVQIQQTKPLNWGLLTSHHQQQHHK